MASEDLPVFPIFALIPQIYLPEFRLEYFQTDDNQLMMVPFHLNWLYLTNRAWAYLLALTYDCDNMSETQDTVWRELTYIWR